MDQLNAQNPDSIQKMFGTISERYDSVNSVLSFGIHHLWKSKLVKLSQVQPGQKVLDCATGTGDLAFRFETVLGQQGKVVGCDFCEPMLEVAREKAKSRNSSVQFELADTLALPYSDATFDVASISFGIRNVQNPRHGLSEMARVVKPGGKVLVLEFGQPQSKWMKALFGFYSKVILPKLGGWISGQHQAYQYLQTSSAAFPCGDDFIALARETGFFTHASCTPFQGGIAYLYLFERGK